MRESQETSESKDRIGILHLNSFPRQVGNQSTTFDLAALISKPFQAVPEGGRELTRPNADLKVARRGKAAQLLQPPHQILFPQDYGAQNRFNHVRG